MTKKLIPSIIFMVLSIAFVCAIILVHRPKDNIKDPAHEVISDIPEKRTTSTVVTPEEYLKKFHVN